MEGVGAGVNILPAKSANKVKQPALSSSPKNARQNNEQTPNPITQWEMQHTLNQLRIVIGQGHWEAYIYFTSRIFALDSVVKPQILFLSHRGFLTYAMYIIGKQPKTTFCLQGRL